MFKYYYEVHHRPNVEVGRIIPDSIYVEVLKVAQLSQSIPLLLI